MRLTQKHSIKVSRSKYKSSGVSSADAMTREGFLAVTMKLSDSDKAVSQDQAVW